MFDLNKPIIPAGTSKEAEKEIITDWGMQIITIAGLYGTSSVFTNHRQRIIDNFALVEGTFDLEQFAYVYDRYGLSTPTLFTDYPDLENKIDNIIGRWLKLPMPYSITVINEDAITKKNDKLLKLKLEALLKPVHDEISQIQGVTLPQEELGAPIPEDIQKLDGLNVREAIEEVYDSILKFNIADQKMILKFKDCLRDMIISNNCIGEVFVRDDAGKRHPYFEKYDPRSVIYDMNYGVEYIADSEWCFIDKLYTISEILEEFRFDLTEEQKENLSILQGVMQGGSLWYPIANWYEENNDRQTRIRVVRGKWLAKVKRIVRLSKNKYDPHNPFVKIMPEGFKIPKGKKNDDVWYEEQLCSETWGGAVVGGTMCVGVRKDEYQSRRESWGYANTKTGFFCLHKKGVSKIGSIANIHHLKNFVMYYIGQVMARPGQAIEYDLSQLPKHPDGKQMTLAEVMADAKEGFIVKDSSNNEMSLPNGGMGRAMATVNLSMGDTLPMLIQLKEMLDRTEDRILGSSPDSQGFAKAYEKTGVVASNVAQSENSLAGLFGLMNIFRGEVYNRICDLGRYCYKEGDVLWWLGDTGMKILEIAMDISNDEVGIFVMADEADAAKRKEMVDLMGIALNAGKIEIEPMLEAIWEDSALEVRNTFRQGMASLRILQQQERKEVASLNQPPPPYQIEVAKINQATEIAKKIIEVNHKTEQQDIIMDLEAVKLAEQNIAQQAQMEQAQQQMQQPTE